MNKRNNLREWIIGYIFNDKRIPGPLPDPDPHNSARTFQKSDFILCQFHACVLAKFGDV